MNTLSWPLPFRDKARSLINTLILAFLVALWSPPTCLAAQETQPVYRVGIDQEYEPYEYVDETGTVNGFTPALLRAIGAETGIRFEFVPMPWPKVVEALEAGQIDIASMLYSPARADHYLFSKPHSQIAQAIFRHRLAKNIVDVASLAGHTVGIQEQDITVSHLENRNDFQKRLFLSKLEGLLHVNLGKTDAFICAQQAGIHLIAEYQLAEIELAAGNLYSQQFAFAAHKGQGRLIEMLNQQMIALNSTGTMQTLRDTWLTGHLPRPSWIEQNKTLMTAIGGTIVGLLLLMTLWSLALKRQVRARAEALHSSEEALGLHRQQLDTTIEALPDVVFLKDGQGRWQIVNRAAQRLFGIQDLAWLHKTDLELIALRPELEPALRYCMASDEQAWLAGRLSRTEECIPHPEGAVACYDVVKVPMFEEKGGGRKGLVVVGRDITERKHLEATLIEKEEELATIFENVPLLMLLVDKERRICRANRAATDFTGLSESDMLGQRPGAALSCIHAHDVPEGCGAGPYCQHCQVKRLIMESLAHRENHVQQEIKHQFIVAGKQKNLTLFLSTVAVTVRQEPMVLVAMQDVSEYKALEDQLQQAQRLESIGTLAGGIAHDFNNILSAIVGYTDLARMENKENPTLDSHLQQVRQAADRATALVRQILTFSRREQHEKTPLQISLIAKEALKLLRASIPTTIAFRQDITSQAMVFADSTQIHQLLMNLCTNAYHAMIDGGGELRVSLREWECGEATSASGIVIPPGRYVELTVSDTGSGMDKQTMSRIFEPYFSTKEKGKGTGLGLAVVHGIVKSHQGHIAVASEQGRGTIFTVYLPVIAQEATITTDSIDPVVMASRSHERIMVVDDEEPIRDLIGQILIQAGYQVDQFTNGTEAWAALRQTPNAWDLLLTDQTMPGMRGSQLAAEAKALRPNLPTILISGYEELLNDQQFQKTEFFTTLIKPVDRHRLLVCVSEMLAKRFLTDAASTP